MSSKQMISNNQQMLKSLQRFLTSLFKEDRQFLQRFFSKLPYEIVIVNQLGEIIFHSNTIFQLFDVDHLEQDDALDIVLAELRLEEFLQSNQASESHKICRTTHKRILTTRLRLNDAQGNSFGALALCEPFSNSVRKIEQLLEVQDLEKVFRNLIGSAHTAYFVTNEAGECQYVNDAFLQLFSVNREQLLGRRFTPIATLHEKALQRRRTVFQESIGVFEDKNGDIVNGQVVPLLINGKLRGTIGFYYETQPLEQLKHELERYKQFVRFLEDTRRLSDLVSQSNEMKRVVEQVRAVVNTDTPMIIRGAIGTGKKTIAHAIHYESKRRQYELVYLSCYQYSKKELDLALFGTKDRPGMLESAKTGTFIVEGIECLPVSLQKKMYKFCSNHDARSAMSVKIIALTSVDLARLVYENEFDQNLFNYLNKIQLSLPTLQERKQDLQLLVYDIVQQLNQELRRKITSIDDVLMQYIEKRKWAYNITELKNFIEAQVLRNPVDETHLHLSFHEQKQEVGIDLSNNEVNQGSLQSLLDRYEKNIILQVYNKNKGNKTRTAEELQISLRSLYYKLEKFNLD